MTDDTMTVDDIARQLGASVRTVRDRWVHDPSFPAPALQPSPRKRRWRVSDVMQWAARGVQTPPLPSHGSTSPAAATGPDAR